MAKVSRLRSDTAYSLLLIATVVLLFLTGAPAWNGFSWPDSPRHALNGAFVLDLVRDMPLSHPKEWAYDYYAKYPALTVLFYPPLFYFILAAFYGVFGVSEWSALLAESACYIALALGSYRLARFWLPPLTAFGVALILTAAPEIAFWGRQVMLEIPSFAFAVWSAVFFMRYLQGMRPHFLYLCVALLVLAMYTKLSAVFLAPVYFVILLIRRRNALFLDRHSYIVAALALIGIVPLIVLTVEFGQANVQSVSGIADSQVSRATLAGWLWYANRLPSQMGWPAVIAALSGLGLVVTNRPLLRSLLFPLLWLLIGYAFFSAIDLKEARHSVFLLLPLAILAGAGCMNIMPGKPLWTGAIVTIVGIATLGITMTTRPVLYVSGYQEVSDFVAEIAPKNSTVVFSGFRDGSFIYAMRTHEDRRDLSIVRADKLLLSVAVRRELGVTVKDVDEGEIAGTLDRLGAHYVVAQPGFWTDLESMRRLETVLTSDHFEPIRRFVMPSNYNAQEKELVVYRNLGQVAPGPVRLDVDLPMVGLTISGTIGKSE